VQASTLLARHRTIAVVVNRVASAIIIAKQLTEALGKDVTITLLTGRMRPLDRDDVLRELRPAVQTWRVRCDDLPKRVIVGTQCIEAGADFDFDALITEAASLDSLRQRFGRVDRLGNYTRAEGVIVFDNCKKMKEELKRRGEKQSIADEDPIYGTAISETVKWLIKQEKDRLKKVKGELKKLKDEIGKLKKEEKNPAEDKVARLIRVDFGVLALEVPTGEELTKLLSPKPSAPTLLPAYLDLWAQTSPPPSQTPDVSLWLHGPSSGPADVQVIWRTDLTEELLQGKHLEIATAIVSAVIPSSLEALSLPFAVACAWLAGRKTQDIGDTEGASSVEDSDVGEQDRPALRWRGNESELVSAKSLKPGDTIVVPSSYGGIRSGCFDASCPEPVQDRAEQASLFARAKPILRLHPEIVRALGVTMPVDDPEEARISLERSAGNADWPKWKGLWAKKLANGRGSFVVTGAADKTHENGWTVIEAMRVPLIELQQVLHPDDTLEDGIGLTTHADDSFFSGKAIGLDSRK